MLKIRQNVTELFSKIVRARLPVYRNARLQRHLLGISVTTSTLYKYLAIILKDRYQ